MLGIQDGGDDGEKLNTPHRIFIEDADRSGVSSGTSSSDSGIGGRVIVNPSHPFENTTIVAKINFGPKGSALLQGPNAAFSNSNSGQSLDLSYVYWKRYRAPLQNVVIVQLFSISSASCILPFGDRAIQIVRRVVPRSHCHSDIKNGNAQRQD